tara:strand:- start:1072 stop:6450 length:5379 start_codon:yes stop_codon:yes gene_type:complete
MSDQNNISFSSVLPIGAETTNIPDIDFSSVLNPTIQDSSFDIENILISNQSFKDTAASVAKNEEKRAIFRENVRSFANQVLPEFALDMYNQSTEGVALAALRGEPVFSTEKSRGLPTSWYYNAIVGVGSMFASPTDLAATATGYKGGQLLYNFGGKQVFEAGANYLAKKNLIQAGFKETIERDVGRYALPTAGMFAARDPLYYGALEIADNIATVSNLKSIPDPEIFISSSGDRLLTYPGYSDRVSLLEQEAYNKQVNNETYFKNKMKGKAGPINLREEKKGLPLDVAFTIDRENQYFNLGKQIRTGEEAPRTPKEIQALIDKVNQYEDKDSRYVVALSEIMNNADLSKSFSAAGVLSTMSAARLGFKYLPNPNQIRKGILGRPDYTGPLATPRGFAVTTGGEISSALLSHPLYYGEGMPDSIDLTLATGIVMASRIPGFLGKQARQAATKYKERPRTGPMSEAMKRKVAEAQDAEVIDVDKIVKKSKDRKGKELEVQLKENETSPIVVGSVELLSPEEMATVIKYSGLGENAKRRAGDIYELVQDPIIALRDAQKLKLGTPLFERTKDGELIFAGESVSDTDQIIRTLNRNDLPGGMASGNYVDQPILGIKKGFEVVKNKGRTREILKEAGINKVEVPLGVNAKIIRNSIKVVGDDIVFDVQVGRSIYALDSKNADLFLKHYTAQPLLKYKFEHNNKGVFSKPFALTRIRRKALRALIRDESNEAFPNSILGDYRQAIAVIAHDLKYDKWLKALSASRDKSGNPYLKPIKVKDLSDIEMKLVTERIQDIRAIRSRTDFVIDQLEGSNLRLVNPVTKDNEIINVTAPIMSELGNQLTSPAAKSLGGLISASDRNIVGRVTNDIVDLQLALGMDKEVLSVKKLVPTVISKAFGYNPFRNELAENWITGKKEIILSDGKSYKGFDDYLKLDANPKLINKWKAQVKKINANPERYGYTAEEINFLNFRVKSIEGIKRIMDDIAARALSVGIQMPGIKTFYMPFVMEKQYRDTIYSSMKSLNEKVTNILGAGVLTRNKDDLAESLTESQKREFKKGIEDWIQGLNASKDKYKNGTATAWTATLKELEKIPGNIGVLPELDVWLALNTSLFNDGFKRYGHLEKKRTLGKGAVTDIDVTAAIMRKKIDLLDNNLATLFTDYILGANKRIELVRTFGLEGNLFNRLLNLVPEDDLLQGPIPGLVKAREITGFGLLPDDPMIKEGLPPNLVSTQKDALRVIKDVLTGESQYSRSHQLSSLMEASANVIFTTKISLGTAIIQNMFQPFISFIPDLGIWSAARGGINYFIDPKVADLVLRAGPSQLSLVDDLVPGVRSLRISSTRIINPNDSLIQKFVNEMTLGNATQALGQPFMYVNLQNKIFAAAAADDYIKKMAKLLIGDQKLGDKAELFFGLLTVADKQQYARNKLFYRFGLDPDEVIKFGPQIISGTFGPSKAEQAFAIKYRKALENYAQLNQAGREFMLDSFSQNDPNARQINLFKRWAKRQAFMMKDIYDFEMANGNYLIPATMAGSGVFGGYLSARGIEIVKDWAAGEQDIRGEKYQRNISYRERMPKLRDVFKGEDRFYMEDLVNATITGGLFGMAGDIVLGDQPFDALKFAVSPAGWGDFERAVNLFNDLAIDAPMNEGTDLNRIIRKNLRIAAQGAGGIPNNAFKRVNYEPWEGPVGQMIGETRAPVQDEINLIKAQRNRIVSDVVDLSLNYRITEKESVKRKINNKITEWNNSAAANKYWNGDGLNPYAIYYVRDIIDSGKVTDEWIDKMNSAEDVYKLKPSDIMRQSKR